METTGVNVDQRKFWNESKGKSWVELQPNIDELFKPISKKVIETLDARPGEKILDIGCGTGGMSFNLSEKVGQSGLVCGYDISHPMLEFAEKRRKERNLSNIKYVEADLQTHKFNGDIFDALFSRFGVMFFEDPVEAFRNLRKVVKKNGRIVFVCWAERLENDWIDLPTAVASRFLELPPNPPQKSPGPFAFEDKTYVKGVLEESGWSSMNFENFTCSHSSGPTLEEAARFLGKMGPMSGPVEKAGIETREKFFSALGQELEKFKTDQGVMMNFSTWIVSAVNQ